MHKFVYWLESRRYDICNDRLMFRETTKKMDCANIYLFFEKLQIFILVMSEFSLKIQVQGCFFST
jgi:hypothetical protein